jgi:alpha-L-fucosidase
VQNVLLAVGDWLKMNGEAIYGTRAWISFGEGPTQVAGGSFHDTDTQSYTPEDFRFTSKAGTLYAIEMAWPANGRAVIHTLTTDRLKVGSVVLLSTGEAIPFKQTADGLQLQLSSDPHGQFAYAYKITLQ